MDENKTIEENIPIPEMPKTEEHGVVYAGFWRRLLAYLIDGLLLAVVFSLTYFILQDRNISNGIMLVVEWLYFAFMENSKHQGTLGKIALGIKVTDMHGQKVSFGRATGRFFSKIISVLIVGIGYIMIAFTKKKQGLHDIIARTLVVKK